MEKIKYILGNKEHAKEIQQYFGSVDKDSSDNYFYRDSGLAYYINPDSGHVDVIDTDSWVFKYFVENGIFEELKHPYSKPKLQVIQGVPGRGDEVIQLLERLGGVNDRFDGDCNDWYYFIEDGQIGVAFLDSDFFNDYDLEILTLPKKEESKQESNVIKNSTNNETDAVELFKSCDCYYIDHTSQNEKVEPHIEFEPFVSKVLVRTFGVMIWVPGIYVCQKDINGNTTYVIAGNYCAFNECIPYEGNEHLVLTSINPELNK